MKDVMSAFTTSPSDETFLDLVETMEPDRVVDIVYDAMKAGQSTLALQRYAAFALAEADHFLEASYYLGVVVAADLGNVDYRRLACFVECRRGKARDAAEHFYAAQKLHASSGLLHSMYTMIHLVLGDMTAVRTAYDGIDVADPMGKYAALEAAIRLREVQPLLWLKDHGVDLDNIAGRAKVEVVTTLRRALITAISARK